IVDRSALTQLRISQQFQPVTTTGSDMTFQSPLTGPLSQTVKVGALSSAVGVQPAWSIQAGTRLQVGSEVVTVTGLNALPGASTITANFASSPHPSGTSVSVPVETKQAQSTTAVNAPGSTTVTVDNLQGPGWSIQPGVQVFVDLYPYQEAVTVASIDTT